MISKVILKDWYRTFLLDCSKLEVRGLDVWVVEEIYTGRFKHAPYQTISEWAHNIWPYVVERKDV